MSRTSLDVMGTPPTIPLRSTADVLAGVCATPADGASKADAAVRRFGRDEESAPSGMAASCSQAEESFFVMPSMASVGA